MAKIEAFEKHFKKYDQWFVDNEAIYKAELALIEQLVPDWESAIEIGVGTGKFASPLGIKYGLEPSDKMAEIAMQKGIKVIKGVGEAIPFVDAKFDFVLMVTTICFLDDPLKTLKEINRILKNDGNVLIGFVDKDSTIGKKYIEKKNESVFYEKAKFFSTEDVLELLKQANFKDFEIKQTLLSTEGTLETDTVKEGYGDGSFVAIKATKK